MTIISQEDLKRLIPEREKPVKGVWMLEYGNVAFWDASIAAWRVTSNESFYPDWRIVYLKHGKFVDLIREA
jgi:hypothetical protein